MAIKNYFLRKGKLTINLQKLNYEVDELKNRWTTRGR